MDTIIFQSLTSKSPPSPNSVLIKSSSSKTSHILQICLPHHRRQWVKVWCTNGGTNNSNGGSTSSSGAPPAATPPETVEIRFKRGSRRRRRQQEDGFGEGQQVKAKSAAAADTAPKKWEEMSLTEKAMELYVGEKGLLFWLNKFAYASIFIVIGAWIVFRFVGPALNLYQLDSPPLSPTSILKGS